MRPEFTQPVPEIPVGNIDDSIAYYVNNLGFALDWNADDIGLAGISRGTCRMFLASPSFREGKGNNPPILIWLNLESKDEVNELYREWSAGGALLVSGPESKPWYLHEFTAKDPDGNFFRVFYDFGGDGE